VKPWRPEYEAEDSGRFWSWDAVLVLDKEELTANGKLVMFVLCRLSGRGEYKPSIEEIAQKASLGRTVTKEAIDELEGAGMAKVYRATRARSRYVPQPPSKWLVWEPGPGTYLGRPATEIDGRHAAEKNLGRETPLISVAPEVDLGRQATTYGSKTGSETGRKEGCASVETADLRALSHAELLEGFEDVQESPTRYEDAVALLPAVMRSGETTQPWPEFRAALARTHPTWSEDRLGEALDVANDLVELIECEAEVAAGRPWPPWLEHYRPLRAELDRRGLLAAGGVIGQSDRQPEILAATVPLSVEPSARDQQKRSVWEIELDLLNNDETGKLTQARARRMAEEHVMGWKQAAGGVEATS
jgi:hypothetical protein